MSGDACRAGDASLVDTSGIASFSHHEIHVTFYWLIDFLSNLDFYVFLNDGKIGKSYYSSYSPMLVYRNCTIHVSQKFHIKGSKFVRILLYKRYEALSWPENMQFDWQFIRDDPDFNFTYNSNVVRPNRPPLRSDQIRNFTR